MTLHTLFAVLVSILIATAVIALSGCGGSTDVRGDIAPTTRGAKEPAPRTVMLPTLAAKSGTLLSQRKGDLSATLLPVACQVTVSAHRESRKATGLGSSLAGKQRYQVTTREHAAFDPDCFTFRIA